MHGRYHDGASALEHAVEVKATQAGLEILNAGASTFWRRGEIVLHARAGNYWRLGVETTPEARLILEKSPEVDAALKDLGVGRGDAIRGWSLVGGLVALALAFGGLMFVAIPMAAEPLAHATPARVEQQLGENVEAQVRLLMRPCEGANATAARAAIEPLRARLEAAAMPATPVEIDFVREDAPNAFALPGGQVMITSGLLETLEDPDALAGVLAHEVGHVKARDGMVALYRNAGLGILLELITGGTGVAQQIVALGGQLAELRYTRGQEERADETAYVILRASGHDPAALAVAFRALKRADGDEDEDALPGGLAIPEWLLSHPDLDARIRRAEAAATPATRPTLSPAAWETVRAACAG
jgi:beta-barrel assembly-enhancing protease